MVLIEKIINDLIDSEKSITSPLLKTKVLASRIGNIELLSWVNNEINGYDNSDSNIPQYRIFHGNVIGTYRNGYTQFNEQPLPTDGLPKEISEMPFNQSVTTLEAIVQGKKSGKLESTFPSEITAIIQDYLQKMGNNNLQLFNAKKYTSVHTVTQILSVIRSKLLDFMLLLDSEFGNTAEIIDFKNKNKLISTIVNNTIIHTGDGSIVNTGSNVKIKAAIKINKGDKAALKQTFLENEIQEQDIEDLITFIDERSPDFINHKFNEKVNLWIQKMLGKAIDGSWEIGIGEAGTLLVEAIKSYYGLK